MISKQTSRQVKIVNLDSNFFEVAVKLKKRHLENLKIQIEEIRMFDTWEVSINDYEELFDEIIESQKETCLHDLESKTLEKLKGQIEELLATKLDNINADFWLDMNIDYANFTYMNMKPMMSILSDHFRLNEKEINDMIYKIEQNLFKLASKDFNRQIKELSNFAVDSFKKEFWFEGGLPRRWDRLQEEEIETLFKENKKRAEKIFEIFTHFKLIPNPMKEGNNYNI